MSRSEQGPPFTPLTCTGGNGASAAVVPYGAQVVQWIPATHLPGGGGERLFVSARAERRVGAAIRGGIPVIFPQFGDLVPGPDPSIRHGFARTRPWRVVPQGDRDTGDRDTGDLVLALVDDAETRTRWPHAFRATLTVSVGDARLAVGLTIENTGDTAFAFTGALHTYLRVGDAATARVLGLETIAGRDQAARGAALPPLGTPLGFGTEIDHLYPHVPGPVTLLDPGLARTTRVAHEGFRDVVVWNPGPERGAALADLEPDGWRQFVCVEAVAADPVIVAPGARWQGAQVLTAGSVQDVRA